MNKKDITAAYSTVYYILASAFSQGVVLVSTRFFTSFLSMKDWGVVQTYGAWVVIISTFIGLNLHLSVRNSYTDMPGDVDSYASSVLFLSLISFCVMTAVAAAAALLFGSPDLLSLTILAMIQSYLVFAVSFYSAKLSMEFRYKARSVYACLPNIVHTFLSAAFLLLIRSPSSALVKIYGNVLGLLPFALFCLWSVFRKGRTFINLSYWNYGAAISIPSILYALSNLILMQCDRIMITTYIGAAATGIYSNAYNIGSILWVISSATSQAWVPWFFKKMDTGDQRDVQPFAVRYIVFFSLGAVGLLMISPEILKLMTPREYWDGVSYMPPIIFSSFIIFLYSFPVNLEFYYKKTKTIARNTLIAAAINVMLNIVFIPRFGAVAAAYTTLFSYVCMYLLQWSSARKLSPFLFTRKPFTLSACAVGVLGILYFLIQDYVVIRYGICLAILSAAAVFFLRVRRSVLKG